MCARVKNIGSLLDIDKVDSSFVTKCAMETSVSLLQPSCHLPLQPLVVQIVLELCQSKQVTDRETVDMHLERIRSLVSTWAAQVSCR